MAANSFARRLVKRALAPLLTERTYRLFQAGAAAWDIRRGAWRESELDLVPHAVKAGDTVLDIGANYAQYAYHLSRAVGPAGRVYSFEPIPYTAATFRLIARMLRLKNVTLLEKGAGDRNAQMTFELPLQDSGAVAAGQAHQGGRNDDRPGRERHHRYPATRPVTCEIVRIDDALPGLGEVSFIKADIEGSELLAFRGAQALIDRDRPTVLCEINTWFLDGFGIRPDELVGFFGQRGYQLYGYHETAKRLVPQQIGPDTEDNFVFVHPRRADRLRALLP